MRAMATTATARPSLSWTARRITAGGMATPSVAIRTAEDCVGCLSHFALLKRVRIDRERGSVRAGCDRVVTTASACIERIALPWSDAGGLHVHGIHVSRVQDMRLFHVAEIDTPG